jgi:hypothetical protein
MLKLLHGGHLGHQLVTALTFPETGLDMSRYHVVKGGGGYGQTPAIYDLKAFALHSGGIGGMRASNLN